MNPASRQDVQNIVEVARNRIMERAVTKQDLAALTEAVKAVSNMHQQSQLFIKQAEYQRSQQSRRTVALETRLVAMENELRSIQAQLARIAEQRPQQIIMPVRPAEQAPAEPAQQYAYRPS